jgi:hypothetical protein
VSLNNPNYQATPLKSLLTIQKAVATLSINEATLTQVYDGQPKAVQVAIEPAGLSGVIVRYSGSLNPPTNVNLYQVDVSLNNPNYQATPLRRTLSIVAAANVASASRRATATQPDEAPALFNLNTYPNPFADKFTLTIGSEVTGGVAIEVVDGKGRSVIHQVVQEAGQGSRTVQIDLTNQESGLYLLNVQSGAKREVVKVFKNNR